jgi:hypothetical protein
MAGIEQKSMNQPDERDDYGEHGESAKVTVGIPGYDPGPYRYHQ